MRQRADDAPRELIDRYGRQSLEQVFLDIARNGEDDTAHGPPIPKAAAR